MKDYQIELCKKQDMQLKKEIEWKNKELIQK